jgi:hypothetical protein
MVSIRGQVEGAGVLGVEQVWQRSTEWQRQRVGNRHRAVWAEARCTVADNGESLVAGIRFYRVPQDTSQPDADR